jgi:hypothetical protein
MKEPPVIDNNDDIKWVKAQRPPVAPPDAETTMWARASLLAHADKSRQQAHLAVRPEPLARPSMRRKISRLLKSHRGVAAAVAVAVMMTAGIAASVIGMPHTGAKGLDHVLSVDQASAKTLSTLATRVLAAPAPKGDATLVLRTQDLAIGSFTGADLYLDDGRYFFSETADGLRAAAKRGPQDYSVKPMLDATAAVATADPEVARAAFLKAGDPQWGGDLVHGTRAMQDNNIWVTGIDVLGAAYGRADVRAGMLRILATVGGVIVKPGVHDGVKTLEISLTTPAHTVSAKSAKAEMAARTERVRAALQQKGLSAAEKAKLRASLKTPPQTAVGPDVMTLTVDAQTGALLVYRDTGTGGTDTGVTVTYDVTRVNAADYGLR